MSDEEEFTTYAGERLGRINSGDHDDYSQADMRECIFLGEFKECIFQYVDLAEADMSNCRFKQCIFAFCDMAELNAKGASFEQCEFTGNYMRDSSFDDVSIRECILQACNAMYADFDDARIESSSLSGNFMHSKWRGAVLKDVEADKILLRGALGFTPF